MMKAKLIGIFTAVTLAAAPFSAMAAESSSAADSSTVEEVSSEAESSFAEDSFSVAEMPLAGGWLATEDITIPEEAQEAFDKALEGFTGVAYEPVGLLATQVVAGINYCFLCRGTIVYPGAEPGYYYVYIYAALDGSAEILDIQEIRFGEGVFDDTDEEAAFSYEHDPRDNPDAMKDIVYNPDAVYGFSPDPESTRLGEYADAIDWTDPEQVAQARAVREDYHESLGELYDMITDMLGEAKPVEEIARAVSTRRNELRLEAVADDPEELAKTKKSNLDTYGHEEGPTPDELYEKYGSWQTVLEKALGTNAGMDACVGLYDEYYDYYDIEED